MTQLALFSAKNVRDKTLRRNYSPVAEEFRREQERRRSWGLVQRHFRRLCRPRRTEGRSAGSQPEPGDLRAGDPRPGDLNPKAPPSMTHRATQLIILSGRKVQRKTTS
ncbi:hypothetical protein AB0J80_07080 [Actinoplanes sp. NPDC049548]|uniref:hypothetical protein n=1 Tax=Actinoplanes sp. NPDC049548 TaxID=3155152 RepID=UPI003416ECA9